MFSRGCDGKRKRKGGRDRGRGGGRGAAEAYCWPQQALFAGWAWGDQK